MKQRIKRLLSGTLCLALLLGLFPITAHAANYDMFITDVRVCDENRDDILGDGVFCFDGDRTLTVHGNCQTEDLPIIASAIPNLLIRVSADSVLHSVEAPAIVANADLTIVGPGMLDLGSVDSCGIYLYGCGGEIRNIVLRAAGTWGIAGDKPDDEKEYLRIYNADVTAAGAEGAVCDFGGGIALDSCSLAAPAGGCIGASAIEDAENNAAKEVSILHTGVEIPRIHAVFFHNSRGENPYAQFVNDGATAAEPEELTADSFAFTGWYTDSQCRNQYDFSAPVISDLHLYSGWESVPPPPTVTLNRLQSAISAAEQVETNRYTDETMAGLTGALADARAALSAEEQTLIDVAAEALEAALAALTEKSTQQDNPFADVAEDTFYYPCVLWALTHVPQITNGIDDTHFSPDTVCSRAQVVTFLWRAAGCPSVAEANNPFADAAAGYFAGAVAWAVEAGVTEGVDQSHFAPDGSCTRAQVVTFLWRAAGCPKPEKPKTPFVDVPGAYYSEAVAWAVEAGITKGTDATHFSPGDACTRAQVVTFLYRSVNG